MRLLFVASPYPPLMGGAASRIYDFARIIASRGHACYVVTYVPLRSFGRVRPFGLSDGVRVFRLPSMLARNPIDQIIPVFLITLGFAVICRPRTVVMSLPPGEPAVAAFIGAKLGQLKTIFDVRDEWEDQIILRTKRRIKRLQYSLYKEFFNALYAKADLNIGTTPSLVEYVAKRGAVRKIMIPNGADTELFKPRLRDSTFLQQHPYVEKDDFLIIYAGHVGWYYRLDVVLQALVEVGRRSPPGRLKLIVMGEGEKLAEYRRFAEEIGLGKSVIFTGEVSRREVAEVMGRSDLGVIPYDDDPLWKYAYPTKIFEHAASGLPTVASIVESSELEQLIKKYEIGISVKPLNVQEFANGIEIIMTNVPLREGMSRRALAMAVNEFSRRKTADRLIEVIHEDL